MSCEIDTEYPLRDILTRLEELASGDKVHVRDVIDTFGEASFIPALLVPALIVVSPLSIIFFLPTIMGLTMALIAAQMVFGRRTLWLPEFILARSVPGERLLRAVRWLRRPSGWIDRQTDVRLSFLLSWPLRMIPQIGCIVAGLMMPFLELVPMSSTVLALAVVLFSVSFLSRDGLFVIYGLCLIAIASLIPVFIVHRFGEAL